MFLVKVSSCLLWGLGQCIFSWMLLFERAKGNGFLTFEFGKDEDNGHCVLSIFTKLLWGECPPPFGSILSKNCNSASTTRRSLSVGMQYLNVILGLHQQHLNKSLPDCMKPIPQQLRICTFWYESLNGFDFLCATSFNSARVVKYELRIAIEDQFIFDVMMATLRGLLAWHWVTIWYIHLMLGRPERIQHSTRIWLIRDPPCRPPLVQCISELSFSLHSVGRWSVHGIAHISPWVSHIRASQRTRLSQRRRLAWRVVYYIIKVVEIISESSLEESVFIPVESQKC
jgi:hypothetical protein